MSSVHHLLFSRDRSALYLSSTWSHWAGPGDRAEGRLAEIELGFLIPEALSYAAPEDYRYEQKW